MAAARWVLLMPAAVAAWCGVAIAGIPAHGFVEQAFCAADDFREGLCYGPDADLPLEILMNAFIALSALAVETVAVLMAPSHRRRVAWVVFAVGSCVAIGLGFASRNDFGDGILLSRHWHYVASAIGAGLLGALLIDHWMGRDSGRA